MLDVRARSPTAQACLRQEASPQGLKALQDVQLAHSLRLQGMLNLLVISTPDHALVVFLCGEDLEGHSRPRSKSQLGWVKRQPPKEHVDVLETCGLLENGGGDFWRASPIDKPVMWVGRSRTRWMTAQRHIFTYVYTYVHTHLHIHTQGHLVQNISFHPLHGRKMGRGQTKGTLSILGLSSWLPFKLSTTIFRHGFSRYGCTCENIYHQFLP